jgi:hypothetical protein
MSCLCLFLEVSTPTRKKAWKQLFLEGEPSTKKKAWKQRIVVDGKARADNGGTH